METSPLNRLPAEFASQLERKYFWWEALDAHPRSDDRILAQAMDLASFGTCAISKPGSAFSVLVDTMRAAEPGWMSERSWEF